MRLEIETRRFYLGRDYSEALVACGALPVLIPLIPNKAYIEQVVAGLDGILLPGSDSDVDPTYYGEPPHPKLGRVVPEKDETDLLVLAEAEKLGLPVLGICFGMQVLNVWRGGSLIQDISSQVENCIKHEQGIPLARNSHEITVADDTMLSELVGSGSGKTKVNSHHHQAIRVLGKGLRASAWASDHVVECIEDFSDERFVFGVQWHPELSWSEDKLSESIFKAFVSKCTYFKRS